MQKRCFSKRQQNEMSTNVNEYLSGGEKNCEGKVHDNVLSIKIIYLLNLESWKPAGKKINLKSFQSTSQ